MEACIGAAFLSTYRLYDSLQVLKRFKILEIFNFVGYEKYFLERFDFDLSALPELEKKISYSVSYRKLFRLGDTAKFNKIPKPHAMKTNTARIAKNQKKAGQAKGTATEFYQDQSKGQEVLKNYIQHKAMPYKHDQMTLHMVLRHFKGLLQTKHLGYTFKKQSRLVVALKPQA